MKTNNESLVVKPYSVKELSYLYGVSAKPLRTSLRQHKEAIGDRISRYYTPAGSDYFREAGHARIRGILDLIQNLPGGAQCLTWLRGKGKLCTPGSILMKIVAEKNGRNSHFFWLVFLT